MLRIVILAVIAILLGLLITRMFPRLRMRLQAMFRHPFVRQILLGAVLRLLRLLIFRR